jgi:hypothetical protein
MNDNLIREGHLMVEKMPIDVPVEAVEYNDVHGHRGMWKVRGVESHQWICRDMSREEAEYIAKIINVYHEYKEK